MKARTDNDIGWLRQARLASGQTAAAYAAAMGVSRITLWRWECGKSAAPQWVRIVAEHVTMQGQAQDLDAGKEVVRKLAVMSL